jgi:carbonic anhydrase/acetyltransferase-like protein (isoleucine patch superfamily)
MNHPYQQGHIIGYRGIVPTLHASTYVAPTAVITGDCHIGAGSSVWFGAVIRADVHHVRVGDNTNIQDGAVCHVTTNKWPLIIGHGVTVGHGAVLHGCTVQDFALVGMGSTVLDGAVVEGESMVAAGALVSPGKVVQSGWLWAGVPARPVRRLTSQELSYLHWSATHYTQVAQNYVIGA